MITRYSVWLNGQGLQDIDPCVYITDVQEDAPEESLTTVSGMRNGTRLIHRIRESLSVTVTFMIREYDTARRKAVADRIRAWAQDGWLSVSDRPGQQLYVTCDRLPAVSSSLKWTDRLQLTFTAYERPFWLETQPVTAAFSGNAGTVGIRPLGNMPCLLEGSISNASASVLNALTLRTGGAFFTFAPLNLAPGASLEISYDEKGLLHARIGDTPVLHLRTAASADDLWLQPRESNTVSIEADRAVSAVIRARGVWR